jgi:hypothetical protein
MTTLEDELRAAMRATAQKMPPGPPPPLTLPTPRRQFGRVNLGLWSRRSWLVAFATVFLIGVVVTGSLAFASAFTGHRNAVSGPFPPQPLHVLDAPAYYVALLSANGQAPHDSAARTVAEVRATATGRVVAVIAVPKPYYAFTGVTAAADDHTFVLVASEAGDAHGGTVPAARYYVLHFHPANPSTANPQIRLQALPVTWIPAGRSVESMALSANGRSLAATVETAEGSKLYVYQLATETEHVWSWSACGNCKGDGLVPTLSWTADGRTVAFLFFFSGASGNGVRLLDTHRAGTNLLADSKLAFPMGDYSSPIYEQVIITPDGRTVYTVIKIEPIEPPGQRLESQIVKFSMATGKQITVLNQVSTGNHFEHIQWTSPTGDALLISGAQNGGGAGVLKNRRYTPIPWTSKIFAAAW